MLRYGTLAAICIAAGQADAPAQTQVIVNRHTSVPGISNQRVDEILAEGQSLLQTVDGRGDEPANVSFQRQGNVGTFSDGNGVVDSEQAFNEIHEAAGNVKIVRSITWCGQVNASIIGCARLGLDGMSIVIEPFTRDQEAVLWMHEYGHNRGLSHRDVANALMRPFIAKSHTHLNSGEAEAFVNGPRGLAAADAKGEKEGDKHDARVEAAEGGGADEPIGDVREFVRRMYLHGIPYEVASKLPRDAVPTLLELLNNPEEKDYWTNIVTTLGFIGDERAVKPLVEFVSENNGEIGPQEFRAKEGALIHLGDLINKTQNKQALAFLKQVAAGESLREARLAAAAADVQEDPVASFRTAAVLGLALSGSDEAAAVIENANRVAPANADNRAALSEAQRIYATVKEKGLAAYRSGGEH
jgi:hypothetical protein